MDIIKSLVEHSDYEDMLQKVYGISSNKEYEYILVAPAWDIQKIFSLDEFNCQLICENADCKTYEIDINKKKIIYITLKIGAPNMMDFCLLCHSAKCDNFIFLGSAGAIVKGIELGDIIVPKFSYSGDGASMYLYDNLDGGNFLRKAYPNEQLSNRVVDAVTGLGLEPKREAVMTIDSIAVEYAHTPKFVEMGASIIEMETSAFFNAMNYISKTATAILVVSDNSANGEHLLGRTEEQKLRYHKQRDMVSKIITRVIS